jgi:predicted metal-dependent phosphoesterase TrpH
LLSAAVLVSAVVPSFPLRDVVTNAPVQIADLVRPAAYVAIAPLSDVLDTLTLLSLLQHVVLVLTIGLAFICWRLWRRAPSTLTAEIRAASVALFVLAILYVAMAVAPRPMAALRLQDPSLVAVDFHSHTNASYDARAGFSAAQNRGWHQAAGFGAAYVSDHHSLRGVRAGTRANPTISGDTTMLLPGLEASYSGQHVVVLGVPHDARSAPVRQWADGRATSGARVALVMTIPGPVAAFGALSGGTPSPVRGIELTDACPRGLDVGDRRHAAIVALADRLDIALLASSDNHGWGRTAVAWSVMFLPGWRGLTADSLDSRIRASLSLRGRQAVIPIGRTRVRSADVWSLLPTAPAAVWLMFRTLSWPERLSWLAWCWGLVVIARITRSLRTRRDGLRPHFA